ncbi:MAG: malonyl-ACP O-methyltransferase BioC [Pseudomonadota bacterium]
MNFSKKSVQAAFSDAAISYNDAAVVQNEILIRLLERLKILYNSRANILDLGSGTGLARNELQECFGHEQYFAFDIAERMLAYAHAKFGVQHSVCGDIESLPFKKNSFDIIFSASTLQWCNQVDQAFHEAMRVLNNNGLFIFSSFGPGTLKELRQCFSDVDMHSHVNTFIDFHDLGDLLASAGFSGVVMESEVITVEYSDPMMLLRDLQATGATNHMVDRPKGLLGKQSINRVLEEYESFRLVNSKYPASYEVIFGHGWKKDRIASSAVDDWQPIQFK